MKHYWMAFQNDGIELFGVERYTRQEAIKDIKEAYKADYWEFGGEDPGFDYYIEEYWETESEIMCGGPEFYKPTMGKRGGVKCDRTRAI